MDQLNFLINRICKLTHITCNTDNVDIGFISINFAKYYHTYFMVYLLKVSKQLIDIRQANFLLILVNQNFLFTIHSNIQFHYK